MILCDSAPIDWDSALLGFESTQSKSAIQEGGERGWSVHYIHEAGSFVPLVQVRQARAMALSETTDTKALMEANGGVYDIEQDPLWNGEQRSSAVPRAFDRKEMAFYQCDHLGTPQELTDHEGAVAWSAQYKAWGKRGRRSARRGDGRGCGTRYGSRGSILMKRRVCITTGIGITTLTAEDSSLRIQSD
ncbi:RHS domain-containing protein [Variovorax sp. GB1R11]|uniref:RHS domain-containing protein n=1 Tax=Variovorax sp. GB1R11 TaxID=3443741 RepID=UPI003F47A48C